jgi:erythromycin esterase
MSKALLATLPLIAALSCSAAELPDTGRDAFLAWARNSLHPIATVHAGGQSDDLRPLADSIGDATLVALSEAVHGGAGPLEFRNRLFQYLVQEKGFTTIAIESGIVEGRKVNDWVDGGSGDLQEVLTRGISWTFDRFIQNQELIDWIRKYNADPKHGRKVGFYGFDVPGSPGNPEANRGVDTALLEALDYLARVDHDAASAFHAKLDSSLKNLRFDALRPDGAPGYDRLRATERNTLTATIADMITLMERCESKYTAISSANDYAWGYRAAIGARQVDNWLRQIPPGWKPTREGMVFQSQKNIFMVEQADVRDRAQVDNLGWIVKREGYDAKVLIYASRYHLSMAPDEWIWWNRQQQVAGTYLKRRYGTRLLTIGNLIGKFEGSCGSSTLNTSPGGTESVDGIAGELGVPLFVLDLRNRPDTVGRWLNKKHTLGAGEDALELNLGQAFDILFYIDRVAVTC